MKIKIGNLPVWFPILLILLQKEQRKEIPSLSMFSQCDHQVKPENKNQQNSVLTRHVVSVMLLSIRTISLISFRYKVQISCKMTNPSCVFVKLK